MNRHTTNRLIGRTARVTPDDPSIATTIRHGADAGHFRVQRDGDVIYHESFHDFGPLPWDQDVVVKIRVRQTFVTVGGDVQVDRFAVSVQLGNRRFDGPPPAEC
jgi:hypothetical protein